MRKILFVGLLGTILAAVSMFPFLKSDAARAPRQDNLNRRSAPLTPKKLPDYDIRLVDKGEFNEFDLNALAAAPAVAKNSAEQARVSAIDEFRSGLNSQDSRNLRAVVNEAGAMKNFFIDGAALSQPRSDTADNIARDFLNEHAPMFLLTGAKLQLNHEDNDGPISFLEYFQTVSGIKVFEGGVQVAVSKNGEVLSVREGFLVPVRKMKIKPALKESDAIARAFEYSGAEVFPSFAETRARTSVGDSASFTNPVEPQLEEVLSELNVVRINDQSRLAWHVYADVGPEQWYEILLDANTGELLLRHNLYVSDAQGTVYTEDPGAGPRQIVSFVGDTTINTAAGWMGTSTVTTGNNVEAYLDTDANNAPDPNNGAGLSNGHASAANQDFTFPFSTAVDPRTQQAAVVTNLFYFNNFMHDFSYRLGFTETARNFQTNNFARGGTGNDSVQAEAQDGSGTNNANFATPPEGQRPRMQQFLFTAPTPDRDSSLDSDVVFHEYGHGISNRLIGNGSSALSGTQSGAMGEGWSDYWSITINGDGAVGE
jgi:extracellular elastinolytic metalloproteinase